MDFLQKANDELLGLQGAPPAQRSTCRRSNEFSQYDRRLTSIYRDRGLNSSHSEPVGGSKQKISEAGCGCCCGFCVVFNLTGETKSKSAA